METALPGPTDEVAMLRQMLAERDAALAERSQELARVRAEAETHAAEIDKLRFLTRQLQRSIYGPRSEKLDPDQLQLALEDLEQSVASAVAAQEAAEAQGPGGQRRPRPRQANRGALPKHLPREEIIIEPEAKVCPCCSV